MTRAKLFAGEIKRSPGADFSIDVLKSIICNERGVYERFVDFLQASFTQCEFVFITVVEFFRKVPALMGAFNAFKLTFNQTRFPTFVTNDVIDLSHCYPSFTCDLHSVINHL
jgi:hypothetical protein